MNNTLQLDITTQCNLKCFKCDRMCSQAPSEDRMSLEQVEFFINESKEFPWKRIEVMGGEPTVHPNFWEIIELLLHYQKNFNNQCELKITTNGKMPIKDLIYLYRVLENKIGIINTNKSSRIQTFNNINVAPCDMESFRNSNFKIGCYRPESCGWGLSRIGYYPCGPGAAIDRVFGFNIGIKHLKDVNNESLDKQKEILCKVCGHFMGDNFTNINSVSETWKKAFESYNQCPPVLDLY